MTAALSQVIRRGLYGVSGLDPLSYLAALCMLTTVLVIASLLPISRALRADVFSILRTD
jgi:ABC-type lipoprotein release transport system permease subunit